MATTTNYGWDTPDDTDLVKDGAAAIRTLGSSVDTTTKALNPSTTEGDIEYRSATANTNTRLAIGTAGQVLTVNSSADAPEWAAAGGGSPESWTLINAGGTALTGAATVTVSGISGYGQLLMFIHNVSGGSLSYFTITFNGVTTADYTTMGIENIISNTYTKNSFNSTQDAYSGATKALSIRAGDSAGSYAQASVHIDSVQSTGWKRYTGMGSGSLFGGGTSDHTQQTVQGIFETSSAITSVSITSSVGNLDAGTLYVLGGA